MNLQHYIFWLLFISVSFFLVFFLYVSSLLLSSIIPAFIFGENVIFLSGSQSCHMSCLFFSFCFYIPHFFIFGFFKFLSLCSYIFLLYSTTYCCMHLLVTCIYPFPFPFLFTPLRVFSVTFLSVPFFLTSPAPFPISLSFCTPLAS